MAAQIRQSSWSSKLCRYVPTSLFLLFLFSRLPHNNVVLHCHTHLLHTHRAQLLVALLRMYSKTARAEALVYLATLVDDVVQVCICMRLCMLFSSIPPISQSLTFFTTYHTLAECVVSLPGPRKPTVLVRSLRQAHSLEWAWRVSSFPPSTSRIRTLSICMWYGYLCLSIFLYKPAFPSLFYYYYY